MKRKRSVPARKSKRSGPRLRGLERRWRPHEPQALTPAQKSTAALLIGELENNYAGGPFPILVSAPGVAEGALRILRAFRHESQLDRRLYELVVLLVARVWRSGFEWETHAPRALAAGLAPQVIAKIRAGQRPRFKAVDERVVYDVTHELLHTHRLSDRRFKAGEALFGRDGFVEIVTMIGFYTMLATTLSAFGDELPRVQGV